MENDKTDEEWRLADFRCIWLKHLLLRHFSEEDGRVFARMLRRRGGRTRERIKRFLHSPASDFDKWDGMTLYFYRTQYEKTFYKWVYITKKVWRPVVRREGSESPPEKASGPEGQQKKKGPQPAEGKQTPRPHSPQTVMEVGPQADCEQILQKVKTLVKERRVVGTLHCAGQPCAKTQLLLVSRKSPCPPPPFTTYSEARAELPKYLSVTTLHLDNGITFKKHTKVMSGYVETALAQPELAGQMLVPIVGLTLPYHPSTITSSGFYECYQRTSRKLSKDCTALDKIDIDSIKKWCVGGGSRRGYTVKEVLRSPLHSLVEEVARAFLRGRSVVGTGADGELPLPRPGSLLGQLAILRRKMNWCLNHIESDVDIEITSWPEIDEIIHLPVEELITEKEQIEKMEKKLELWERYIKNLLTKCRSKDPKGSGPVAEYQYWFKREDHIGPLLLTLYGKDVSSILSILNKVKSPAVESFLEKRLSLKRYYEISRDNRDYISVSIQCLEGINCAKDMDEVQKIIPEFWKTLRYLWLLSGYWAVKNNIVEFIERVQYLIVKKSIKVLEVNHFFSLPQRVAKQLAEDVIRTMGRWKSAFYEEKARIEQNQWEMRWEFPTHRLFTTTDYIAKLAKDFSYIADGLKEYLEVFGVGLYRAVACEVEGFTERVHALTGPFRSADFNIYDPENDVHWNLLVETFVRELGTIQREAMEIINRSFKSLRSSIYATNLLLTFKEEKSEGKSYAQLSKKFEFVNIQLIKEMKLINKFILNRASGAPVLSCHSILPGKIHWMRHLCTSFQYRFVYLENVEEIKSTVTLNQAKRYYENFMLFYDLYQFGMFLEWKNCEKDYIENQLSRRIFRLKNIVPPITEEDYADLVKEPIKKKMIMSVDSFLDFETKTELKSLNKIALKSNKPIKLPRKLKFSQNNYKSKSFNTEDFEESEVIKDNGFASSFMLEDNESMTKLLMYMIHEEKRMLQNPLEKGPSGLTATHAKRQMTEPLFPMGDLQKGTVHNEVSPSCSEEVCDKGSSQLDLATLPHKPKAIHYIPGEEFLNPIVQSPNETFFTLISSQFARGRSLVRIMHDINILSENMMLSYSKFETNRLKIMSASDSPAALFLLPLFVSDSPKEFHLHPYSGTSEYDLENPSYFSDYRILNKTSLFALKTEPHMSQEYDSLLSNEDKSLYEILLKNPTGALSMALQEFSTSRNRQRNSIVKDTSNRFKEILRKKFELTQKSSITEKSSVDETSISFNKKEGILWHEYFSGSLLIEKGHLIEVNFDLRLFDVVMEIYQIVKLGYNLPREFHGLGLLNFSLKNDIKNLQKVVDKYNAIVLDLTKESLLSLKYHLLDFEYLLLKGLNYYSWHTTKVDMFYDHLNCRMEIIVSLNRDVRNILHFIERSVDNIKIVDWFDFNGLGATEFIDIKDFFSEIERRRDLAFNALIKWFDSIPQLFKMVEYLVFRDSSGENRNMVLYYKFYEETILKAILSNLIWNLKKFQRFIIGAESERVHLKIINTCDVEFNYSSDQCTFFFLSCIEKLLRRYEGMGRWMAGSCRAHLSSRIVGLRPLRGHNFLGDLARLGSAARELVHCRALLRAVSRDLETLKLRWKSYRVLWNFDKELTTDSFFQDTRRIIERCDTIFCYYDHFIEELSSCKDYVDVFCMRVEVRDARGQLLEQADRWQNCLRTKLSQLASRQAAKLHSTIKAIHDALIKKANGLDDFENVLQAMKDFEGFSSDYGTALSFITEIQYILGRHGLKFSETNRSMLSEIQHLYSETGVLVKYRAFLIKPSFNIYKDISLKLIKAFGEECSKFAELYYSQGPGKVGEDLDHGYELLQKFKIDFEKLNARRRYMVRAEVLFEHIPNSYDFFDEANQEFHLLQIVYDLYLKQKGARQEWAKIPWIYLGAEELAAGMEGLLAEFSELEERVRELSAARQLLSSMLNFRDSIPIMVCLKNEALKERHWKELMDKTGYHFEMLASKFVLNDLFSMKLFQHKDIVDDIIGKARCELEIENYVHFIKEEWEKERLNLRSSERGRPGLENGTTLLSYLDHTTLQLQRVTSSQFALPFLKDLKDWERKLSNISSIVQNLLKVEEDLTYLRTIFEDRGMQKVFLGSFQLYMEVEERFTKLVGEAEYKGSLCEQAAAVEEGGQLAVISAGLEQSAGLLATHLSTLRDAAPRLYLVGDRELLSLIGSSVTSALQQLVTKVFYNIQTIEMEEWKEDAEVKGLVSSEMEVLSFQNNVKLTSQLIDCFKALQKEMKFSCKYMTKMCIYNYATVVESRIKWIMNHLTPSVLAAIHVWWTAEVEDTFLKIKKGELQAMKSYLMVLINRLRALFQEVKGSELQRLERVKLASIILADLHARDVVDKLANNSIMDENDFEWLSQLKMYWKKSVDTLFMIQCTGEFPYGFEYTGVGCRLSGNTLTERLYLSLTQALLRHFPPVLFGPPNTGKTETVRSLSSLLGVFCVFTNCTYSLSIDTFSSILCAMCLDGIWACFDNFNLIKPETMSLIGAQIDTVREAVTNNQSTFFINGKELLLMGRIGIFITMNPGFLAKDSHIPQSVKRQLRPVACMVPQVEQICYAILYSEGFSQAQVLSKKITKLYELANDQLSRKGHYDFSLRALKPLLSTAGDLKRNAPDMEEKVVLMRAIRDSNRSKFLPDDEIIFMELMGDVFPGVDCPSTVNTDFEEAVKKVWSRMDYFYVKELVWKVSQLSEVLGGGRAGIVTGPTGGGKSLVINSLSQVNSDFNRPTALIKLCPKALPTWELFGDMDNKGQWQDGLLTQLVRDVGVGNGTQYILCDGDMDYSWLDFLASALDDNRLLSLPNGERIPLHPDFRFIFETDDLTDVSPCIISRTGVVYVDPNSLGYIPFWKRWISSRIDETEMELLDNYFEKYVPPILELIFNGTMIDNIDYAPLSTLIPQTKLNLVVQLSFMIDAMYPIVECEIQSSKSVVGTTEFGETTGDRHLESIFLQAVFASLGAVLHQTSIPVFDSFVKGLSRFDCFDDSTDKKAPLGFLPTQEETLFEYCADTVKECWIPFRELVDCYVHHPAATFNSIIVPHKDSCRLLWLLKLINEFNCKDLKFKSPVRPLLIVGESSSNKTTTLREFSMSLDKETFSHLSVALSWTSTSRDIQEKLAINLDRYTPFTLVPKIRKNLIVLIDDLHRPQADAFGTQETSQFLKLLIENSGMFLRGKSAVWQTVRNVYYNCVLTLRGRCETSRRLLSLFSVYSVPTPTDQTIRVIYSALLKGHTQMFTESIRTITNDLVEATLRIYKFAKKTLLPTPQKFHYSFNMRDISRIFKGLSQTSPAFFQSTKQLVRVWRNEVTRVLCDRLVLTQDEELLKGEIKSTVLENFPNHATYILREPLLFGDYRNATQKGLPRDYEDLLDYEAVYHLFTEILEEIKSTCPKLNLVLFEEVLDHLTRIHRVLRLREGHLLVVGPPGSGKRTLVKLASYTADCKVFQIILNKEYGKSDFICDIKKLFQQVFLKNQPTTFILTSHQIVDEGFLEILNIILTTGSFIELFTEEERSTIMADNFFNLYDEIKFDKVHFWEAVDRRSQQNLHVALLLAELNLSHAQRFPALLDHTIIDWIRPWPPEALSAIAWRHLKDVKWVPEGLRDGVVRAVVTAHQSLATLPLSTPTTPSHFLHFIQLFIERISEKFQKHHPQCHPLDQALEKVNEAIALIEEMKENIKSQRSFLEEKENICKNILGEIENVTLELLAEQKSYSEKGQDIEAINLDIGQQMTEIQAVLSRALGDIDAAQEAIRDLDIQEITDLSLQELPTEMTSIVFESVLVLLGEAEVSWEVARKLLSDQLFLNYIEEINLNTISLQQQKQVRASLKRIDRLKNTSICGAADRAFLSLVEAILGYSGAFRETKPKQEKIAELEKQLNEEKNELNNVNIRISKVEEQLTELKEKQFLAHSDFQQAQDHLESTLKKLNAADKLITGLENESKGWRMVLANFQKEKNQIVGDSLVCSSFLAYCGPFNYAERKKLISEWIQNIKQKRIPISNPFELVPYFTNEITLCKWNMECLPKNEWSRQNAILALHTKKRPLCIDPMGQAVIWITRMEKDNKLTILSYGEHYFLEKFKNCMTTGNPVLIKSIDHLEPIVFENLLSICEESFGDLPMDSRNVDVRNVFYMVSDIENPKFDPCIFSLSTVINFSMTSEDLEEHLLNIFIESEEQDLWIQSEKVKARLYWDSHEGIRLRKDFLRGLTNYEGSILQTTDTIQKFHHTTLQLQQIDEHLQNNKNLWSELERKMNTYQPIAKCGATAFFILVSQYDVNQHSQISLMLFDRLFLYCVKNCGGIIKCGGNINDVVLHLKKYFYNYSLRESFSAQKLLISLKMSIEFEKANGDLSEKEVNFFIFGGNEACITEPPFYWLSQKGWSDIHQLSKDFQGGFLGITEHMNTYRAEWEEWYNLEDSNKLLFPLSNKLQSFQKLMLLRCLSINFLPPCIENYVNDVMGTGLTNLPFLSMDRIVEESSPTIPIILITTPGTNPWINVLKITFSHKMMNKLDHFMLGLEESPEATKLLEGAIQSGRWAVYYNCHMDHTFICKAMNILESAESIHEDFRLWLTTEPKTILPSSILQASIKVVIDTPETFKTKLCHNYEEISDDILESCGHHSFKRLVYATSFLHSVLQERHKYGRNGWNLEYEFGKSEFEISVDTIREHLKLCDISLKEIPWKAIKYLIGEIIYGGHVLDEYDRRIITTYLEEYYDNSLCDTQNIFSFFLNETAGLQDTLPELTRKDYLAGIEGVIEVNTTRLLGLHKNNQVFYQEKLINDIWAGLALLQGDPNFKPEKIKEKVVLKLITDLEDTIPETFDKVKIKSLHWDKKYIKPIIFVLLHEVELFNTLVQKVSVTLKNLKQALCGKSEMEDWMRKMCDELYNGSLPSEWKVCSPQTNKALGNWFTNLSKRTNQYKKWASEGQILVMWLGGLHFPKSYLLSHLQVTSRKKGLEIENLIFKTWITGKYNPEQLNEQHCNTGCYISEALMEGAKWDSVNCNLVPMEPNLLISPLPILHVLPSEKFHQVLKENLKVPVYKTSLRNSTLRGLVFEANISSFVHISKWILQGVSITLSQD